MKHALKIFILLIGFVLYFNVNSFANIDIGAYGGYIYSATLGDGSDSGLQFGAKAHYNIQLGESIDLGLGAFFQSSSYKGELLTVGIEGSRKALGLDVNLIYSISPESDYYPYVRVTYSLSDKMKVNVEDLDLSGSASGKGWGIGGGIEYNISPNLRLFVEYMVEKSSYSYEFEYTYTYPYFPYNTITTNMEVDAALAATSINVGIKYFM